MYKQSRKRPVSTLANSAPSDDDASIDDIHRGPVRRLEAQLDAVGADPPASTPDDRSAKGMGGAAPGQNRSLDACPPTWQNVLYRSLVERLARKGKGCWRVVCLAETLAGTWVSVGADAAAAARAAVPRVSSSDNTAPGRGSPVRSAVAPRRKSGEEQVEDMLRAIDDEASRFGKGCCRVVCLGAALAITWVSAGADASAAAREAVPRVTGSETTAPGRGSPVRSEVVPRRKLGEEQVEDIIYRFSVLRDVLQRQMPGGERTL
jgi:hypothetical protein